MQPEDYRHQKAMAIADILISTMNEVIKLTKISFRRKKKSTKRNKRLLSKIRRDSSRALYKLALTVKMAQYQIAIIQAAPIPKNPEKEYESGRIVNNDTRREVIRYKKGTIILSRKNGYLGT